MNDNARKWVKALRSGEFKQGKRRLRDGDAFCCLGVACDLFHRDTGLGAWDRSSTFEVSDVPGYADHINLPIPVRDWLGLEDRAGAHMGPKGYKSTLSD